MEGPVFTIYLCRFWSHVITIMNCNKHNDHLLFELLEQTLIWCSQNIMNLGNLVQLVGSREERIQAETHRYYWHSKAIHTGFISHLFMLGVGRQEVELHRKLRMQRRAKAMLLYKEWSLIEMQCPLAKLQVLQVKFCAAQDTSWFQRRHNRRSKCPSWGCNTRQWAGTLGLCTSVWRCTLCAGASSTRSDTSQNRQASKCFAASCTNIC